MFKLIKKIFKVFRRRTVIAYQSNGVTEAQLAYLEILIDANNNYRAVPWQLDDWIQNYYKGRWDSYRATKLIEKLKLENAEKLKTFKEKINDRSDRIGQDTIYASDFSAYGFCPNSFYLTYRGYANRNLYELKQGHVYHGEFSKSEGHTNQNNKFLKEKIAGIKEIKWLKINKDEPLYDKERNLSGLPDGIILFEDRKLAIVEIKSTRSISMSEPYLGDIIQACAYKKICGDSSKVESGRMNADAFIIYIHKESGERQLFTVDSNRYENHFQSSLSKMKNIDFQANLYQSEKNLKKCAACGYRALCRKMSQQK